MQLTLANTLLFLSLLGLSSAAPAPEPAITNQATYTVGPVPTGLPKTCSKYLEDPKLCYTATTTETVAPSICPMIKCVEPTGHVVCPPYIKVTTVEVPCSTDCCPKTPTATVTATADCPGCTAECVVPTTTVTATTGVCGGITVGPLPSATTH
ncbi:hypothetical protein B0J18DRAFT_35213 [Chaetomium sp. MPI-SDFR-AT-0129]|nr:hypothetical protein B0J18DRAFT_35213 [Chaetomium sp. MPI-SDFR-AT-0129]